MKSARYFGKKNGFPSTIYFPLFFLSGLMASCGGGGSSGDANLAPPPPVAGPGSAIVFWDQVTTNNDNPPTPCTDLAGYRVYYDQTFPIRPASDNIAVPVASLANPTKPSYEIKNLPSGVKYYFGVSSYDASGNSSTITMSQDNGSKVIQ